MQGQFLFAGSLFSPLQFFQNHLVDFVDVTAAHGDDQVTWFNVVADILADIRKVLVFAFIIGFWVGFILWKPNSSRNFFAKLTGKDVVSVLFPRAHNIR